MNCPHNEDCVLEFVTESWDRGDSSTPYFESGFSFIYDGSSSYHVTDCPGLTYEEIETLEKKYNEEYSYDGPFLGVD